MPAERYRYIFKIDALSPQTIPMARLAEYMTKLAAMFGNQERVHCVELRSGSTILVNEIESEALPEVRERIHGIRINEAPAEVSDAYAGISALLRHDRASAVLLPPESAAPVLKFPGEEKEKEPVY